MDAADSCLLGCSIVVILCTDEGAASLEKFIWKLLIFTLVSHVKKRKAGEVGAGAGKRFSQRQKKQKKADGHNHGNWKSIMSSPFTKAASATTKRHRQNPLFLSCLFENQRAEQRNIPAGEMLNIGS